MIDLGDAPVTLDPHDPVERALTAVAVERRRRRRLAAVWDDRFDFPVAVLLDLLDDLEAAESPSARQATASPSQRREGVSGAENARRRS